MKEGWVGAGRDLGWAGLGLLGEGFGFWSEGGFLGDSQRDLR